MRDIAERRGEVKRGEVNRGLDDGLSKAFELALTPAILGGVGWLLDSRLEVTPLFTLVLFLLGVVGTSVSVWSRYNAAMDVQQQAAAAARAARPPRRRTTSTTPESLSPEALSPEALSQEALS